MTRNIDRRIEAIVPIYDDGIRVYLREVFEIYWKDTEKARVLDHSLSNTMRNGAKPFRAQDAVYEYTSAMHKVK